MGKSFWIIFTIFVNNILNSIFGDVNIDFNFVFEFYRFL